MGIIAHTILSQMGGASRLTAMIGAKQFITDKSGWLSDPTLEYVRFNFPMKSKNGSKQFVVLYDAARDLYNIEWWKQARANQLDKFIDDPLSFRIKRIEGVFADQLRELFEQETGLYLTF